MENKNAKKGAAESTVLFCSGLCIACLALCKRHSHSAFHWACHSWCGMLQPRSQFVICLPFHWNLCQAMENMVGMNGNLSTARSLSAKITKTTYWVELFCYYVTIPVFFPQFLLSRNYTYRLGVDSSIKYLSARIYFGCFATHLQNQRTAVAYSAPPCTLFRSPHGQKSILKREKKEHIFLLSVILSHLEVKIFIHG